MNAIKYLSNKIVPADTYTLQYWEIYVADGVMEAYRGGFSKIIEIYVPELNIGINQYREPVHIFVTSENRYSSNNNMSGKNPKLLETIKIYKDSETGNILKWLEEFYREKKEKETKLVKLFNQPRSSL